MTDAPGHLNQRRRSPAPAGGLVVDVVPEAGPHRGTVVWMHGIGQDGRTLIPIARRLNLAVQGIRSVFPWAPHRAVPLATMPAPRAWFEQSLSSLDRADLDMLAHSERLLGDLLATEAAAVSADRLVLAGFSQGALMALATGLRYPRRLAGLALYAPFLVSDLPLGGTRSATNRGLPIWIGHGRADWIVPVFSGAQVRLRLARWGHPVTWRTYPGAHEPFQDSDTDLNRFLGAVLG